MTAIKTGLARTVSVEREYARWKIAAEPASRAYLRLIELSAALGKAYFRVATLEQFRPTFVLEKPDALK